MDDAIPPLPDLSPVSGKRVAVKFDGGLLSSDGGVFRCGSEEDWTGLYHLVFPFHALASRRRRTHRALDALRFGTILTDATGCAAPGGGLTADHQLDDLVVRGL